jgi:hypothetical protein
MSKPHGKSGPTSQEIAQAAFIRDLVNRVMNVLHNPGPSDSGKDERLKGLEKYVNQQIQINLGAWQEQADNAITDAHAPAEEEDRFYFYVALAGNLMWASTCFLDPAVAAEALAIKIMSFSGATVGSGTLEKYRVFGEDDTSPDDAKVLIRQMLAKKRGELEEVFKGSRQDWAANLDGIAKWEATGDHPEQLLDLFDKYIWEAMFPTIPFNNDRFDSVRGTFLKVINNALADFNRQFKEYRQFAAWYGAAERKKHGIYFQPVLKIWWGGKLISGRVHEEDLKWTLQTKY